MRRTAESVRKVSIHAPVRVRPRRGNHDRSRISVSIHAPVRVRRDEAEYFTWLDMFQSTHP